MTREEWHIGHNQIKRLPCATMYPAKLVGPGVGERAGRHEVQFETGIAAEGELGSQMHSFNQVQAVHVGREDRKVNVTIFIGLTCDMRPEQIGCLDADSLQDVGQALLDDLVYICDRSHGMNSLLAEMRRAASLEITSAGTSRQSPGYLDST